MSKQLQKVFERGRRLNSPRVGISFLPDRSASVRSVTCALCLSTSVSARSASHPTAALRWLSCP
eukprot:6214078-Pleurochrysis_carterae.AAC.5